MRAASVVAAVRFLTVIPTARVGRGGAVGAHAAGADDGGGVGARAGAGAGTGAFPLAGLLVGVAVAAPLLVPLPDLARATLALTVGVAITGGLHEDAWADVCDAAFAPGGRARRVAVLDDPRVGAHGVTGVAVLLLLRLAAFVAVAPAAVVAAAVVGRWAMVAAARFFPPVRSTGLGAWFVAEARPLAATGTALLSLSLVALAVGSAAGLGGGFVGREVAGALASALAGWAGGAAAGLAAGRLLAARLGGLNGDGFGSVGVAAELGALWVPLLAAPAGATWWS